MLRPYPFSLPIFQRSTRLSGRKPELRLGGLASRRTAGSLALSTRSTSASNTSLLSQRESLAIVCCCSTTCSVQSYRYPCNSSAPTELGLGQPTKPLRRPARDAQCQPVFVPRPDDLRPEREPVRPLNAGERDAGEPEQRPHPAEVFPRMTAPASRRRATDPASATGW